MKSNGRPLSSYGDPWEQMAGETVQQYEKFCAYRDMRYIVTEGFQELPRLDLTRERSIRGLARELKISRKSLEPLSVRFRWVERCEAYDLYHYNEQRQKEGKCAII